MAEFRAHFRQDPHQFLPIQQHIIGPFDLGIHLADLPDGPDHRHGTQKGHLRRFLGQESGFQQQGEP